MCTACMLCVSLQQAQMHHVANRSCRFWWFLGWVGDCPVLASQALSVHVSAAITALLVGDAERQTAAAAGCLVGLAAVSRVVMIIVGLCMHHPIHCGMQ